MAITAKCLNQIAKKIGRSITPGESAQIEFELQKQLRQLAQRDPPAFRAMPLKERLTLAAKFAKEEAIAAVQRSAENKADSIVAAKRNLDLMHTLAAGQAEAKGLARLLTQADTYIKGTARDYFSQIIDTIHAAEPRFFEFMENKEAVRDFAREVFGVDTGNPIAKKGAKAWLDGIENLRQRLNRVGGDVGKLDYGYLPQPHGQARILKAGAEKFINDNMPRLPWDRYLNPDGTPFREEQQRQFLAASFETLSTGGMNKMQPGERGGSGALANRHSETRQIHFKDADAYLDYMRDYGKGNVFDAMQRHVGAMARDIGLIEQFGPNAAATFKTLNETAIKMDGKQKKTGALFVSNDERWNTLTGVYANAIDPKWAEVGSGVRNFTSAVKLQGNLLSSLADIPTFALTAHYNNLPILSTLLNAARNMGLEDKGASEFANRVGLVSDSIIADMNRWAGDNLAQGWTGKLANTTQKISLMNRWTDALKRSFSVTYMGAIGKMTRGEWGALDAADRGKLEAHGIDQATFDVWRAATPENWRGSQMLTPESIRAIPDAQLDIGAKDRAVSKLLGMIADESDYAVISPDLDTRARVQSTGQRGTVNGELGRALYLFKSFPMAMVSRQLTRIAEMDDSMAKLGYSTALMTGLTLFGALSLQAKDLVAGKDPRDMTGKNGTDLSMLAKFWGAAFAQGGGAGIFGDILYTGVGGNSRGGQPNWTNLAGPVIGTAFDVANVTLGNIGQATAGQKTNFGAEAARLAASNLPFLRLWFLRSAIDHGALHEMQEQLSPGYLSRMRATQAKEYNSSFWWEPGHTRPRAPNFEAALGGR